VSTFIIVKYGITAGLIVVVSEIAKRSDKVGAFIGAMPLVTTLTMMWLFIEMEPGDGRTGKIANHAWYTFWYVLPTMPMFLLMPWMLRRGANFFLTLGCGAALTFLCFGVLGVILKRFEIHLW
jgi:hypothetical protein